MSTPLTSDQQRLADFLQAHSNSSRDLSGGLCEFVSCAIVQGQRVREWCADDNAVLNMMPTSLALRNALISPHIKVLLPYTNFSADPYFPAQPPLPAPLIASLAMSTISRKQLIETLASFSRQLDVSKEPSFYTEELVVEICLEYIGRRWREGGGRHELVEEISKKLTEVEFELQLQGHPAIVKSTILPALHKVRFNLGLVTSSQLSTKLNGASCVQAYQLVQIWLERRLVACVEHPMLIAELQLLRSKLLSQHRYTLRDVVKNLGLDSLFALEKYDHFALTTPSTANVIKRTRSTPLVTTKMGGKSLHTPKWFSHKRHSSSSSKVQVEKHHRASLPTESTTSSALEDTAPSRAAGLASTHEEILFSLMAFSDPEDIQAILLSHLVALRYHAQGHDDGWFLGGGQVRAGDLLDFLEKRMVGRKDVIGLKEVFAQLRQAFGITSTEDPALEFNLSIEDESPSDLYQYLSATSMGSPSLHSASSLSVLTVESQSQNTHSPRLSEYTIREAKVEYPHESRATACHLPLTPGRNNEQVKCPCSMSTPDLLESRNTPPPHQVNTPFPSSRHISDLAAADVSSSFDITNPHSTPRQSLPPRTPDSRRLSAAEKNRRAIHRNFAIFNGEPLTPSPRTSASVKRPTSIGSVLSASDRPKVPRRTSSLKPFRRVSFSPDTWPAKVAIPTLVPLAHVMGLFHGADARGDVTPSEVRLVMEEAVRAEQGRIESDGGQWDVEAKDKVVWLFEQVKAMLNDDRLMDVIDEIKENLNDSKSSFIPAPNLRVKYPHLEDNRPRSMESLVSQSSTYSTPSALDWPTTPSPSDPNPRFGPRSTSQRRQSSNGTFGAGASLKEISIASMASIVLPG